jgi:hypothetical protein
MNTPTDRRVALGLIVQPFLAFGMGCHERRADGIRRD